MITNNKLGHALRHYRKSTNLTLSEVGKITQISVQILSDIERGKREPTDDEITAILYCYGQEIRRGNNETVTSFKRGWQDAVTGNTIPLDELWDGIDAE